MNSEKVSVIIPAFNAAKTLPEAVYSVLNGTYHNIEILIVDDCSSDNTAKVAAQLAEENPPVQYFQNQQNYGVSKSRNLMIEKATGDLIAFLDSDDTWEPKKLEICLKILKENPDIKAVSHALYYLDKHGQKKSYIPTYPTTREEMKAIEEKGELPWSFPSATIIYRETLLKEKGFREDWPVGEDTELFARIAQKYGLLATKEPLANYRIKGNSLTDKYWLKKRIANDCIKENQKRRIQGEKELSLSEYENTYFNNLPQLKKLNKLRELLSLHYMRKAGQNWLNQDFLPALFFGVLATGLNPQASMYKLKWMKQNKKLSQES
ncbi:glycosyl transferase family 2 [Oscillatoriales cyanobacterium USR001]|nr:glycosyl transferase family 2 [Oscillatoriales cyanobacterium USR001]